MNYLRKEETSSRHRRYDDSCLYTQLIMHGPNMMFFGSNLIGYWGLVGPSTPWPSDWLHTLSGLVIPAVAAVAVTRS
jgi:hypothetical protein